MATSRRSSPKASGTFEFLSGSVEETHALGERLGRALKAGDVVALCGALGTGKTMLVQGIARGLGLDADAIKSPTFVLMREYAEGRIPLIHLDGYRLSGAPEAAWLDTELMFDPRKITVIEWAERFEGLLPEHAIEMQLSHVSTKRRRFVLGPTGPRATALIGQLQAERVSDGAKAEQISAKAARPFRGG